MRQAVFFFKKTAIAQLAYSLITRYYVVFFTCAQITAGRKFDSFLRAADDNGFANLAQISTNSLEFCSWHLNNATVIGFLELKGNATCRAHKSRSSNYKL